MLDVALMATFVSLLRGINVGGNKTIPMSRLKALCEALGFGSVKTHLNSGNVVFQSDEMDARLTRKIEAALEKEFGFRPAVIIRNAAEMKRIVEKNPFADMAKSDPSHLVVMFLASKPDKNARARLAKAYSGTEEIRISGETVYLTYPNGIGKSKLSNTLLEKHLGVTGTARNWNTVAKLSAIAEGMGTT